MKGCSTLFLLTLLFTSCSTSYYYVVRHAERQDNSSNTPLSAAGFKRAETLRDSLSAKHIDYIFASTYLRTRQTVQPLADLLSEKILIYDPNSTDSIVTALKNFKGKSILIAGHSDTVPDIIAGLSGQTVPAIKASDFDNLYIVKIRTGLSSGKWLLHKTYGVPTE